ncbi:DNA cytosine methyltransferase [Caballeronia sp. NK8]|uniref:DNA cytosine methyltransferase n=1 Tax=Caballeronia sp. NK8 TaxID=140098 RepID=UPI001BCF0768|nr:DNA cytosine methyltransferase [Caballeronia sp. NK8]
MKILDLFCCAGGAAMGYHIAGFDVVGVDIAPQPNYPFSFVQSDVLSLPAGFLKTFDAIHASPPCQGYSAMRHAHNAKHNPRLIDDVRKMLEATGLPYVIENVEAAKPFMRDPFMLCGTMFGLGLEDHELRRHRLFETNWPITDAPQCRHTDGPVIGVYGGHARRRSAKHGGRGTKDVWPNGHKAAMAEAMQITWANTAEMSEAIPPAYTEWIGRRLYQVVCDRREAAAAAQCEPA